MSVSYQPVDESSPQNSFPLARPPYGINSSRAVVLGRSQAYAGLLLDNSPVTGPAATLFREASSSSNWDLKEESAILECLRDFLNPSESEASQELAPGTGWEFSSDVLLLTAKRLVWLATTMDWDECLFSQRIALQALLPMAAWSVSYSSGASDPDTAFKDSTALFQRAYVLQLLCETLPDRSIYEWFELPELEGEPFNDSVENAFDLSLKDITERYWELGELQTASISNAALDRTSWNETSVLLVSGASNGDGSSFGPLKRSVLGQVADRLVRWNKLKEYCVNATMTRPSDESNSKMQSRSEEEAAGNSALNDYAPVDAEFIGTHAVLQRLSDRIHAMHATGESLSYGIATVDPLHLARFDRELSEAFEDAAFERMNSGHNEMVFIVQGEDRSEVSRRVRNAIQAIQDRSTNVETLDEGLRNVDPFGDASPKCFVGVATVSSPTRSFDVMSLLENATRCLEAATVQGTSGLKSIQVY